MSTDDDKLNLCRLAAKSLHGVLRQTWKMPTSVRTNPNINFFIKAFYVAVSLAPLDNRSLNWKSLWIRIRFYMDFSRFWCVRFYLISNILWAQRLSPALGARYLFLLASQLHLVLGNALILSESEENLAETAVFISSFQNIYRIAKKTVLYRRKSMASHQNGTSVWKSGINDKLLSC